MRVRWLRAALQNLDTEAEYIARDSPAAAARVVASVEESVRYLATHPAMGRPGRVPGTRELVVANLPYVIPYRMRGEAVEILRVFHGKRKWPRKL